MAWYYKDGENAVGPVNKAQLQALIKEKKINAATLVRDENSEQWRPLGELVGKKKTAAESTPQSAQGPSTTDPAAKTPPAPPLNTAPEAGPKPDSVICSQCGRSFSQDQVVQFEGQNICAACKPLFVQRLREGVDQPTDLRYAGFWIRTAAKIIDGIILMIIQWAILLPLNFFVFSSANLNSSEPDPGSTFGMAGMQIIVSLLIPAIWVTFFVGRFAATPGKMACRIKIIAPDGKSISYLRAFGRFCAEFVSSLIMGIGYLMAAFDNQKKALHDRIASTRVVYK